MITSFGLDGILNAIKDTTVGYKALFINVELRDTDCLR